MPRPHPRFGGGVGRKSLARLSWILLRVAGVDISYRGVLTGRYQHARKRGHYSPTHTHDSDGILKEHAEFLYAGLEARRRETEARVRELLAFILGSCAYVIGLANTARVPAGYPWTLLIYLGPLALCFRTQEVRHFYEPQPQFLSDSEVLDRRDAKWAADVHHCFLRNETYHNTRVEYFRGARRMFFLSTAFTVFVILFGVPRPSPQAHQEHLASELLSGRSLMRVEIVGEPPGRAVAPQALDRAVVAVDSLSKIVSQQDSSIARLQVRIRRLERKRR